MVAAASPRHRAVLDYGFLLLTHIICGHQQTHLSELQVLKSLAEHMNMKLGRHSKVCRGLHDVKQLILKKMKNF
jgi:hypothetical protein